MITCLQVCAPPAFFRRSCCAPPCREMRVLLLGECDVELHQFWPITGGPHLTARSQAVSVLAPIRVRSLSPTSLPAFGVSARASSTRARVGTALGTGAARPAPASRAAKPRWPLSRLGAAEAAQLERREGQRGEGAAASMSSQKEEKRRATGRAPAKNREDAPSHHHGRQGLFVGESKSGEIRVVPVDVWFTLFKV